MRSTKLLNFELSAVPYLPYARIANVMFDCKSMTDGNSLPRLAGNTVDGRRRCIIIASSWLYVVLNVVLVRWNMIQGPVPGTGSTVLTPLKAVTVRLWIFWSPFDPEGCGRNGTKSILEFAGGPTYVPVKRRVGTRREKNRQKARI
jgi:hypothetical protein